MKVITQLAIVTPVINKGTKMNGWNTSEDNREIGRVADKSSSRARNARAPVLLPNRRREVNDF